LRHLDERATDLGQGRDAAEIDGQSLNVSAIAVDEGAEDADIRQHLQPPPLRVFRKVVPGVHISASAVILRIMDLV
jgi:hypothetical protein